MKKISKCQLEPFFVAHVFKIILDDLSEKKGILYYFQTYILQGSTGGHLGFLCKKYVGMSNSFQNMIPHAKLTQKVYLYFIIDVFVQN